MFSFIRKLECIKFLIRDGKVKIQLASHYHSFPFLHIIIIIIIIAVI
jgi:hypothetical protein